MMEELNQPKKKKSVKKRIVYTILISLLVLVLSFTVPISTYLEIPGGADSLNEIIEVNDKKDTNPGSFYMTTVGILRATVATWVISHFEPFVDRVSKEELFGGTNSKEYAMIQKYYLETSQNNAQMMALKRANLPYKLTFKGIYVMDVVKGSDFQNKLEAGDLITKVDDHSFESSQEFISYVKGKKEGDEVSVTFTRNGETKVTKGKLKYLEELDQSSIGIRLVDHTDLDVPNYNIKFNLQNVGGPSAGMMFTLELYSMLTNKDLKKGRKIAGTGTMEIDGSIGRIGGIDKKIAGANEEGVDIFLAPDDYIDPITREKNPKMKTNYEEAVAAGKKLKTKMKIVPVKSLEDAIKYLEK